MAIKLLTNTDFFSKSGRFLSVKINLITPLSSYPTFSILSLFPIAWAIISVAMRHHPASVIMFIRSRVFLPNPISINPDIWTAGLSRPYDFNMPWFATHISYTRTGDEQKWSEQKNECACVQFHMMTVYPTSWAVSKQSYYIKHEIDYMIYGFCLG